MNENSLDAFGALDVGLRAQRPSERRAAPVTQGKGARVGGPAGLVGRGAQHMVEDQGTHTAMDVLRWTRVRGAENEFGPHQSVGHVVDDQRRGHRVAESDHSRTDRTAIMTPLLEEQLSDPRQAKAVRSFPVPVGGFGDARHMADWICFMLSDSADFLCGSIGFVDGGTDAYFRADDWPKALRAHRLIGYLRRFKRKL